MNNNFILLDDNTYHKIVNRIDPVERDDYVDNLYIFTTLEQEHLVKKITLTKTLSEFVDKLKLEKKEKKSLIKMINSEIIDDIYLAMEIIINKTK